MIGEEKEFPIAFSDLNLYGETKEEVEKNILSVNRSRFRAFVERVMFEDKISVIDAITEYCDEYEVDIEDLQPFIEGNIRNKLEEYASVNNLLKRSKNSSHLPI